jgi:hypothetical protein
MNEKANGKHKPFGELSARERAAFKAFDEHKVANPAPRLKVSEDEGTTRLSPDHPETKLGMILLMEALGSMDRDFVDGLLGLLANASAQDGEVRERLLNFMLAVVKGIKPKAQVEAMLAAQMAAVHVATMRSAGLLGNTTTIAERDFAERALNKLARTFTTQMEALKRCRTTGEQKAIVQHVAGTEGAQSVVAKASPEATPDKAAGSKPTTADARIVPIPKRQNGKERIAI